VTVTTASITKEHTILDPPISIPLNLFTVNGLTNCVSYSFEDAVTNTPFSDPSFMILKEDSLTFLTTTAGEIGTTQSVSYSVDIKALISANG
jgi:hypothetical protein